jgi:uncharacterized membrane protein
MNQTPQNSTTPDPLKFRVSFIALPLICLLLTVILSAIFYGQLPDKVIFRFDLHGNPSGDPIAKASLILLMVGIQVLFTLIAFQSTSALGRVQVLRDNVDKFLFSPTRLLALMGNMPAIIQAIMVYILIDAIVYAKNADHIIPLWIFSVATLVIGGAIVLIYGLPIAIKGYKGITSVEEKKKE